MRLPNGYGSVYKLSGRRRNPWAVRKTGGWIIDDSGKAKQQYKYIGFYHTKSEALAALAAYNADPYDLQMDSISFAGVYEKWSSEHYPTISSGTANGWRSTFKLCAPIHEIPMRDLRVAHLEKVVQEASTGTHSKKKMQNLMSMMYKYALRYEIVDKDYSAMCNHVKLEKAKIKRIPFSNDEISKLWENEGKEIVDLILIGIYSGWRPSELIGLKISDIDLTSGTMTGGMKTDAGIGRIVPVHSKVHHIIERRIHESKGHTLSSLKDYQQYRNAYNSCLSDLHMKHYPHDTRHTFVTLGKEAGMNEYILKLIVGHSVADLTERVYTHRGIEELKSEIEKIK